VPVTQATAVKHKLLDLTIDILAAQKLPLPNKDDSEKGFRPYVKVELHVEEYNDRAHVAATTGDARAQNITSADERDKEGEYKARSKTCKGRDPDFKGEALRFDQIPGVVPELAWVRFLVKDDEFGRDGLAAWACVRLDRLQCGYRFVHLLDRKGQETEGLLLVKVAKKLLG